VEFNLILAFANPFKSPSFASSILKMEVISAIQELAGVKSIETDTSSSRIVITFDKSVTGTPDINALFKQRDIETVLLNQVGHAHRKKILEKEAKF